MMEVAAAISLATSAFRGIKNAIETGREAQDLIQTFGKFFDASDSISQAIISNGNVSMAQKLFSGNSVEAQALEITSAKHRMLAMEKELREFLIYSGQSAFYEDMMEERRKIRRMRIMMANRASERKAFWIDMLCLGLAFAMGIGILVIFGVIVTA
jgi:hypothetical protein